MAIKLYPVQQEAVDKVIKHFNKTNKDFLIGSLASRYGYDLSKLFFLTAEVGSGKTYMAAGVTLQYVAQGKKVLVFSPPAVVSKWEEVLEITSENPNPNITIVNVEKHTTVKDFSPYDLIIFDEVHLGSPTLFKKLKGFGGKVLGVTATLDGSTGKGSTKTKKRPAPTEIAENLFGKAETTEFLKKELKMTNHTQQLRYFIAPLLSFGATRSGISKDLEMEEDMYDVKYSEEKIALNEHENLFYQYLKKRFVTLELDNGRRVPILNDYFDRRPLKETVAVKRENYFIGKPLVDSETKFKKIQEKLNEYKGSGTKKGVLIYTFDDGYAKDLADYLGETYVDCGKEKDPAKPVQELLAQNKVAVININHTLEGVDYQTDHLIFAQIPKDAPTEQQAVGRITRMSSERTTKYVSFVYFNIPEYTGLVKTFTNHKKTNAVLASGGMDIEGLGQADGPSETFLGLEIIDTHDVYYYIEA